MDWIIDIVFVVGVMAFVVQAVIQFERDARRKHDAEKEEVEGAVSGGAAMRGGEQS